MAANTTDENSSWKDIPMTPSKQHSFVKHPDFTNRTWQFNKAHKWRTVDEYETLFYRDIIYLNETVSFNTDDLNTAKRIQICNDKTWLSSESGQKPFGEEFDSFNFKCLKWAKIYLKNPKMYKGQVCNGNAQLKLRDRKSMEPDYALRIAKSAMCSKTYRYRRGMTIPIMIESCNENKKLSFSF